MGGRLCPLKWHQHSYWNLLIRGPRPAGAGIDRANAGVEGGGRRREEWKKIKSSESKGKEKKKKKKKGRRKTR